MNMKRTSLVIFAALWTLSVALVGYSLGGRRTASASAAPTTRPASGYEYRIVRIVDLFPDLASSKGTLLIREPQVLARWRSLPDQSTPPEPAVARTPEQLRDDKATTS